jgi:ribosome-associated protein
MSPAGLGQRKAPEPGLETEALLALVLKVLEDGKAKEVTVLDVRQKTSFTDYMVVASGSSERHVKALAGHVAEASKQENHQPFGVEGDDVGEWVLVDLGGVIVHVMKPQIREFYQLEKLWRGESGTASMLPAHTMN